MPDSQLADSRCEAWRAAWELSRQKEAKFHVPLIVPLAAFVLSASSHLTSVTSHSSAPALPSPILLHLPLLPPLN